MAYLIMLFTALFWAGAFIAAKIGTTVVEPMALAGWRFIITGLTLLLIMRIRQPGQKVFPKPLLRKLVVLGIIGMAGYHFFFLFGIRLTGAANASFIVAINPIVVALLGMVVLRERVRWITGVGMVIALIGVVIIIARGDMDNLLGLKFNPGDLLMIGAPTLWAWYSVYTLKWLKGMDPVAITTATTLTAGIILAPFVIADAPNIPEYGMEGWSSALFLAFFASVFGFVAWQYALEKVGTALSAVFINLVPVFTLGLTWLFFTEIPSLATLGGAALTIAGVIITIRTRTRPVPLPDHGVQ